MLSLYREYLDVVCVIICQAVSLYLHILAYKIITQYPNKNNKMPKQAMNNHHVKSSFSHQIFPETVPLLDMTPLPLQNHDPQAILQAATVSTSHSATGVDPDSSVFNAIKFFQQFKRIYFISFNLYQQKNTLFSTIQGINDKIISIEKRLEGEGYQTKEQKSIDQKAQKMSEDAINKRLRRTAQQIQKKYTCEVTYCKRQYGSEGSLQQHIKLKHPQLRKQGSEVGGSLYNADNDCSSI